MGLWCKQKGLHDFCMQESSFNGLCSFREMSFTELRSKYTKVSSSDQAKAGWTEDYNISADQVRITVCALLDSELCCGSIAIL